MRNLHDYYFLAIPDTEVFIVSKQLHRAVNYLSTRVSRGKSVPVIVFRCGVSEVEDSYTPEEVSALIDLEHLRMH